MPVGNRRGSGTPRLATDPARPLARAGAERLQHPRPPRLGGVQHPPVARVEPDVVDALERRAGLQGREVGAGIGLGEHRRRQNLGRGQLRQVVLLLIVGSAEPDEFGGDLAAAGPPSGLATLLAPLAIVTVPLIASIARASSSPSAPYSPRSAASRAVR